MINGIGKYLKGGFYSDRSDIFDSAIEEYSLNRSEDSLNIISNLMIESGFRNESNCFIDLEKEFFDGEELDREKCDKFKKELILYYSYEQLKYSFYGTQSSMTRITHDELKREGKDYKDYLPSDITYKEEKAKSLKEIQKNNQYKKENKVPIYIYADGSLSTKVDNSKTKTAFNRLGNTGGSFNFSSGYDPNNTVKDKSWVAGFSREGEWQLINNSNDKTNETSNFSEHGEIDCQIELLFDEDMIYLLDANNLLMDGVEEEYYSVSGELYAKREIDRERSINSIKEALQKAGTKFIKALVLKDDNKETVKYYKKHFKEFITKDTKFSTVESSETTKEIEAVKEKKREEKLSKEILDNFYTLKEANRNPDDIPQAIDLIIKDEPYSVELNIFSNPEDMALFLADPIITKNTDEETLDYIQSLSVPVDKSIQLSRSVQNIITNNELKETKYSTKELIDMSFNNIVNNRHIKPETITKETSVKEIINSNKSVSVDLNNQRDKEVWLTDSIEKKYNKTVRDSVDDLISNNVITESRNRQIVNGLANIQSIAASTGTTPVELIKGILSDSVKDKKIVLESSLPEVIESTSLVPSKRYTKAEDKRIKSTKFDLTNTTDIVMFSKTELVDRLTLESREQLINYLKTKPVSIKDSKEFSVALINGIKNSDTAPILIAQTIADEINGVNDTHVQKEIEKSLKLYNQKERAEIKYNLLDDKDINSFSFDPLLDVIDDAEKAELLDYLKTKPVTYRDSEKFSKAVLDSVNSINRLPEYTKLKDVVESIARRINGFETPNNHKPFVDNLFKTNREQLLDNKAITSLPNYDKKVLENYLNSKPEITKAFSNELTRSLNNLTDISNSSEKPVDIARRISRQFGESDTVSNSDLITSELNIARKSKTVTIEDIKSNPVFSTFSLDEQSEILNLLNSRDSDTLEDTDRKAISSGIIEKLKLRSLANKKEIDKALMKALKINPVGKANSVITTDKEIDKVLSNAFHVESESELTFNNVNDVVTLDEVKENPVFISYPVDERAEIIDYLSNRNSDSFNKDISANLAQRLKLSSSPSQKQIEDAIKKVLKIDGKQFSSVHSSLPVNNLSNSINVKEIKSNPVFTSYSADEQQEIINYLNSDAKTQKDRLELGRTTQLDIEKALTKIMNSNTNNSVSQVIHPELSLTTYNLLDSTSLESFKSDPVLTGYSKDDQLELINYLRTTPVEHKRSKEYSKLLYKGLQRNKTVNPKELAVAISKIVSGEAQNEIPTEMVPVIKSAVTVNSNDNVVPLEYNLLDSGDINRFKFDPILSNFSDADQMELINYLGNKPVEVKNSPQFSSRLMSGLRSLPKSVSPLKYASSLAASVNRGRTSSVSNRPTKSYNLFNSKGLSSFYRTSTFNSSGVDKARFTSSVNNYKSSLPSYSVPSSVYYPLSFRSVSAPTSSMAPVSSAESNSVYNQGYVVRRSDNANQVVKNIGRKKVDVYKGFSAPKIETPKPKLEAMQATKESPITYYIPPVQSTPQVNNSRPTMPNIPNMQQAPAVNNLSPEEAKMQRIQENYINDKEAISNQGRGMPTGQQMLAKSKTKDVGSAGGSSGNKGNTGREVNQLSEVIADEIRTSLDSTI